MFYWFNDNGFNIQDGYSLAGLAKSHIPNKKKEYGEPARHVLGQPTDLDPVHIHSSSSSSSDNDDVGVGGAAVYSTRIDDYDDMRFESSDESDKDRGNNDADGDSVDRDRRKRNRPSAARVRYQ